MYFFDRINTPVTQSALKINGPGTGIVITSVGHAVNCPEAPVHLSEKTNYRRYTFVRRYSVRAIEKPLSRRRDTAGALTSREIEKDQKKTLLAERQ